MDEIEAQRRGEEIVCMTPEERNALWEQAWQRYFRRLRRSYRRKGRRNRKDTEMKVTITRLDGAMQKGER